MREEESGNLKGVNLVKAVSKVICAKTSVSRYWRQNQGNETQRRRSSDTKSYFAEGDLGDHVWSRLHSETPQSTHWRVTQRHHSQTGEGGPSIPNELALVLMWCQAPQMRLKLLNWGSDMSGMSCSRQFRCLFYSTLIFYRVGFHFHFKLTK